MNPVSRDWFIEAKSVFEIRSPALLKDNGAALLRKWFSPFHCNAFCRLPESLRAAPRVRFWGTRKASESTELEVVVRDLGLTPLQAIACATSANAIALGLAGEVGALREGYLADLLIVRGEVARDVTLLGERERIQHLILGGKPLVLAPPLPRRDPPGWRVSHYGRQILRRDMVLDATAAGRGNGEVLS